MLRATDFATSKKLFIREQFSFIPADAPKDFATQLKGAALNTFDLMLNGSDIGWNWGKGNYVPPTPDRLSRRRCKDASVLRFCLVRTAVMRSFAIQISHPSSWRIDL